MIIETIPAGPFATNAYILACPTTKHAAIVDPGIESAEAINLFLEEQELTAVAILLTHSHWDHIGDVALLKKRYNIPVYIHPLDAKNLESPGSDGLPLMYAIASATPDHLIEEGEIIPVGTLKFEVIHTPGHTPGGVCFFEKNHHCLISGDTLFKESIGNLSFPTANAEDMWRSLEKLNALPSNCNVFPGHGPATTLANEKRWLPHAKELF